MIVHYLVWIRNDVPLNKIKLMEEAVIIISALVISLVGVFFGCLCELKDSYRATSNIRMGCKLPHNYMTLELT